MISLISSLQWWHWWVLAALLGLLEALFAGAVAIWFAVGAALVGGLVLVTAVSWPLQLLLFAVLSLGALALWRRYGARHRAARPRAHQGARGAQNIGQLCLIREPIIAGFGQAQLGDVLWRITGPALPAGVLARIVAIEGSVLVVEGTAGQAAAGSEHR